MDWITSSEWGLSGISSSSDKNSSSQQLESSERSSGITLKFTSDLHLEWYSRFLSAVPLLEVVVVSPHRENTYDSVLNFELSGFKL